MNMTIAVWLLISLPGGGGSNYSNVPTTTVAEFADAKECKRVREVIVSARGENNSQPLMCIEARVIQR